MTEKKDAVQISQSTLVKVTDYIPDIVVDLKYATADNFTGHRIYDFTEAYLRYGTVQKLRKVQEELRQLGLSLKIWDAYRPTAAQFTFWEICPDDTYIANPYKGFSSHSRGNAVDVTLVTTEGEDLPMPTEFDDFSVSTIREVLDFPEPFHFEDGAPLEPDKHKPYEIRLENVSFRYPESQKDILSNIHLTIHPGEKLAVVGLNGAGKTTLIKLICGFLDPTGGRILLNGRDIREYNRRDYYGMFSAVFQDFSILACSIAANVAQSEDNIDLHRVKLCIDKAGLTDKIQSLPAKYDTHLVRNVYDDAIMLSGGETQRLMLARALYKDAPFIILDEPTAALDPIAEADLYQKYAEMTEGCSSIYISHRLASTRFCDRILLIENGGIAEAGTHEELLALGGTYAQLFAVQSKYYQEGGVEDEL